MYYCTNYYYQHPIIAQIEGEERSHAFRETGHYNICGESTGDLFFAPEKHEGWINIFKSSNDIAFLGQSRIFESKEDAQKDGKDCESYVINNGDIDLDLPVEIILQTYNVVFMCPIMDFVFDMQQYFDVNILNDMKASCIF